MQTSLFMLAAPLVTALLAAAPLFEDAKRPLTGVVPPPGFSLESSSCTRCHGREAHAVRDSGHAQSWSSPIFQRGWARTPIAWCVNCHAPLPEVALRDEGINCAVCHVREGAVLTAHEPSPAARRAHPTVRDERLASSELCAGCHQFNFPKVGHEGVLSSRHPMQNTFAEWRSSSFAATACQGCHEHGRHGAHDEAALRAAVQVDLHLEGESARVRFTSTRVGHRLPTGDLFRALELDLCADAACEEVLGSVALKRTYRRDVDSWRVDTDTSIPAPAGGSETAEREVLVKLRGGPRERVHYRLRYAYDDLGSPRAELKEGFTSGGER
jgi:hypothetical protein